MIGSSHSPIISICTLLLLSSTPVMAQTGATGISPAPITLSSVEPPVSPANTIASSVEDVCKRIDEKLGSVDYDDCASLKMSLSGATSVNQTPILLKAETQTSREYGGNAVTRQCFDDHPLISL